MVSPPKPWERIGATAASASSTTASSSPLSSSATATAAPAPTPSAFGVPERPDSFSASALASSSTASPYNRFGVVGPSTYSSLGTYGSSYGGMGSMGGMGGYGGYGSTYGSYGGMNSYGGMGGYGGYGSPMSMGMGGMYNSAYGMGGMPGQPGAFPGQPPSLTQTLESTTHTTFALLHSIVQTFGGVAQMLESTFMATHSSFFAMVGVVDQFTMLRNALGSVLGVFGLLRWLRDSILGPPAMSGEFKDFVNGRLISSPSGAPGAPGQPKISKKPLVVFLLALFGVPYLLAKFIRLIAARQAEQGALAGAPLGPLDPSQLTFARAVYPFTPAPSSPHELALKENEIVAIMGKLDPRTGVEVDPRIDLVEVGGGEWWRGRTRDGREGWFPRKWVEIIEGRKEAPAKDAPVKTVD